MENCPDEYYYACSNAQKKCSQCAAGKKPSSRRIFFYPVVGKEHTLPHPYEAQVRQEILSKRRAEAEKKVAKHNSASFKEKQKLVKRALRMEKIVTERINKSVHKHEGVLSQTVASGSVFGDGDIKGLDGLLQLDHKLRTTQDSFSLSRKEYKEGMTQGTNGWVVTAGKSKDSEQTVVILTEDCFSKLLALVKKESDYGSQSSSESI